MALTHLDLFSGIGGFALAARWVGDFQTIAFCEIDKYARGVLKKNFKGIPIFEDVTKLHPTELIPRDGIIQLITAGFPCQDLSVAGARRGIEADRSGLFFEIVRIADELYAYCGVRPMLVLENVPGLLSGDGGAWARRVYGELAGRGYHCEWKIISAADVGAPHLRRRWWCIAYVGDTSKLRCNTGRSKQSLQGVGAYGQAQMADSEGNGNRTSDGTSDTGRKNVSRRENPLGIKLKRRSKAMADSGGFGHRGRNRTERGAGERIFQQEEQGRHPLGGEIARRSEPCGEEELADSPGQGLEGSPGQGIQRNVYGSTRSSQRNKPGIRSPQRGLGGMDDGIPSWLDEPGDIPRVTTGQKDRVARLKGLGNAVVPQVAMIPLLRAKEILTGDEYP